MAKIKLSLILAGVFLQSQCLFWGANGAPEFPTIPEYYSTNILINVFVNPVPNPTTKSLNGYSIAAREVVDEGWKRALLELMFEFPGPERDNIQIEKVIFNAELEGVNNFLSITEINGAVYCEADKVSENSILGTLIGMDPSNPTFPTIGQFLHMDHTYTFKNQETIIGIPCDVYEATKTVETQLFTTTYTIKYYWNDRFTWVGTAGNKSIPVYALVTGETTEISEQIKSHFEVSFAFENFKETPPSPHIYNPPADIWCKGREPASPLARLPETFTYGSEIVFPWDMQDSHIVGLLPTTEFYDYRMKASRTDHKPLNFQDLENPFDDKSGFVSAVKDFVSGVEYTNFQDFANCSVNLIGLDMTGDVSVRPDGSIHMTSPNHLWQLDSKFVFNGVHEDRGIKTLSFVHLIVGEKENFTVVIETSADNYVGEGDTELERRRPIRYEVYPQSEYNEKKYRVRHNIFGLRKFKPAFNTFDITGCFNSDQLARKAIRLGWHPDMIITDDLWDFEHRARRALHQAAKITALRVQNIEVEVVEKENSIYLFFVLVDWPSYLEIPPQLEGKIPPEATLSLAEAVSNLAQNISSGGFEVPVRRVGSDQVIFAVADPDYFADEVRQPKNTDQTLYSPGAMAGLAFGMIFLTLAVVGGVYFFFLKGNTATSGVRGGFGNPNTL